MTASAPERYDVAAESRWWYVVALTSLFGAAVLLFSLGLALAVALAPATDLARFLPAFLSLFAMALAVLVAFPFALYRDAEAVGDDRGAWQPSGARYAALGVVGALLTGFVAVAPVGLYYLYKRHRYVGVP